MVILDVMTIAAGFLLRVVAGALAIPVAMSFWLLLCTSLLALVLALGKRRHEVVLLTDDATHDMALRAELFGALGTAGQPVIFTSDDDRTTWAGGDPSTGTWRATANEWGNLTLMGRAYISEDAIGTNTATPSASNFGEMEGLTPPAGSTVARYGGGDK